MYSEASLVLCPRNFLRCCVPGTLIGHSCSKTLNGKYVVIALRISATRRSHVSQHADVNAQAHVAPWKVHQLPFDLRVTIAGCWATPVRGQASCLVGSVTGACQVAQVAPLWKPFSELCRTGGCARPYKSTGGPLRLAISLLSEGVTQIKAALVCSRLARNNKVGIIAPPMFLASLLGAAWSARLHSAL